MRDVKTNGPVDDTTDVAARLAAAGRAYIARQDRRTTAVATCHMPRGGRRLSAGVLAM
jgi:hypothetical protein